MEQQNKYRVIVSARAAQMLVSHSHTDRIDQYPKSFHLENSLQLSLHP